MLWFCFRVLRVIRGWLSVLSNQGYESSCFNHETLELHENEQELEFHSSLIIFELGFDESQDRVLQPFGRFNAISKSLK